MSYDQFVDQQIVTALTLLVAGLLALLVRKVLKG